MIKKQITNIKCMKFLLLLGVLLIVIILPSDATFERRIVYMLAGGIVTVKVRSEKVIWVDYLALIVLVYLVISFIFPVIMPIREVVYTLLRLGGPYGIVHFLTGEVIGYIFIPKARLENGMKLDEISVSKDKSLKA